VGDAISSVGVILAAVLIQFTHLLWIDPLISILIGCIILVSAYRVLRGALHILVEGVPKGSPSIKFKRQSAVFQRSRVCMICMCGAFAPARSL